MAIKKFKPTSPGRRSMTGFTFDEITKTEPEKSLLAPLSGSGGRNNQGRKTARHRGGGHKRKYRIIDFRRDKDGIPAKVAGIEYDPNRSARIALLHYADGEKRYILAPVGLKPGDMVMSGPEADIKPGNALQLRDIPTGTMVHNIELHPGKGGQMQGCRTSAQLMAKEGKYATLRRLLVSIGWCPECRATIGQVGNVDHENVTIGRPDGLGGWKASSNTGQP